ncbi:N-acetylmuramoyl-L-alanine amidase [Streptomyces sp. NBC_01239]|uniref:peptidoglycan recognition protein family protein n=1 Tax=Streptomyces sp. NBC_01239 TaxID=2903792 RepID=UPI0022505AC6|nr:peptidoglycan recognition family protein [Streptomyces sp. NBC_01239]MCX4816785.1 N-acetylmuramoyl-L-alanine amidase [Streptomyces sp. NBC_01239]MCX4818233.1 N-acetylmuramoyl-L-alanine amidase [Streptomyces sp. NBC_01239]
MATPMTSTQVVAQLKKWGIKYVEIPGWATHNRNQKGAWGPVYGFVLHHTGADVSNASAKSYASSTLYNGITDLPGPLCHFSIGLDGTVYLVGWGRANHAGGGDPAVLQHVINEDYTGQLHPTKGNSNGVDGNAHFYGVEIQYSGGHEMSADQYTAARRLSAAILDFHNWSERSVIAHGEWSSDKWDPGYAPGKIMAMPGVRADVKATHAAGPNQEDDVALTADDIDKVAAATVNKLIAGGGVLETSDLSRMWGADVIPAARPPYNNTDYYGSDGKTVANGTWTAGYTQQTQTEGIREAVARVKNIEAGLGAVDITDEQVAKLAAQVAAAPGLADVIAAKVADLIAARLAE